MLETKPKDDKEEEIGNLLDEAEKGEDFETSRDYPPTEEIEMTGELTLLHEINARR